MEILNNINKRFNDEKVLCDKNDLYTCYDFLLLALSPIAPHISENLYKNILNKDIEDASWPEASFFHRNETEIKYLVQVNGKVRANILIDSDKSEDDVKEIAKEHENVSRHLENKDIIKVIFIKNRLINFVHS